LAKKEIAGLKLIRHNAIGVNRPDDPTHPFKMELNCRPPEFMDFTFVAIHGGSEEVVVRGMTKEAIDEFVELNHFRQHPRLRSLTITGPDGILEQISR